MFAEMLSRLLWRIGPYRRWWKRKHTWQTAVPAAAYSADPRHQAALESWFMEALTPEPREFETVRQRASVRTRELFNANAMRDRDWGRSDGQSDAIRNLVESAVKYCEYCPIQGTCEVCGVYHGSGAE